jgi:Uncharacterized membrane protein (homolog of Drosophila rhomboid)
VTEPARDADNFCYRHPDRQSYVLCQRCGRTICPECQTQAPVGVHCPECTREARQSAPRRRPAIVTALRRGSSSTAPVVTYGLIALCALIYVVQLATGGTGLGGAATKELIYAPLLTESEPWRMVTAMFIHGSIWHIALNMYSLLIFGPILESAIGRGRFLALYLLSGLGGSVAVLFLSDPRTAVLGASGAIFGLLGAFFVIQRRLGGNSLQLLIVIGLNLVAGFVIPGIAWQAHVGGLLVGGLVAFVLVKTRQRGQRTAQLLGLAGVLGLLILLTVVGWVWLAARFFG